MALLALPFPDWQIASATIREAQEYDRQRLQELVKGIGQACAEQVAKMLAAALHM